MYIRRALTVIKPSYVTYLVKYEHTVSSMFSCRSSLCSSAPVDVSAIINTYQMRNFAMDKPKKLGKKKVELREDMLAEYFNIEKLKMELNNVIDYMKDQYQKQVSLRSIVGAIENITIEYEGEEYKIQDLAQVNRKNPKVIALNFSAFPQTIPTVMETIQNSGMNLNPQQDGNSLFIPVPRVTKEHREKLAKTANAIFVKCKTGLKEVETMYYKKLEMKSVDKPVSVEQDRIVRDQLRELSNSYLKKLEEIKSSKLKELMGENDN